MYLSNKHIFFLKTLKPLAIVRDIEYNINTNIFRSFDMIQYIPARETTEKWEISQRRVAILCSECRLFNVAMLGSMLIIPRNAENAKNVTELLIKNY
jgi:hypothetical protein